MGFLSKMIGKKTKVSKSIGEPTALKSKVGKERKLAYSPEFKRFSRKQKFVFEAKKLIEQNFVNLGKGRKINAGNMEIRKAHTGKYGGNVNKITLKVSVAGKEFFVKVTKKGKFNPTVKGNSLVDKYLKTQGGRINGFNVKVIKPHLVYENVEKDLCFFVTEFFNKDEVALVSEMFENTQKMKDALEKIERGVRKMPRVSDISEFALYNTFFMPKTNTLLLFDI